MNVFLSGVHWEHNNGVHVTGFVRENDKYLRNTDLADYFSAIDSPEKFEQKLKNANGQFSVVIERPDALWAATDRLRNHPLFYSKC